LTTGGQKRLAGKAVVLKTKKCDIIHIERKKLRIEREETELLSHVLAIWRKSKKLTCFCKTETEQTKSRLPQSDPAGTRSVSYRITLQTAKDAAT
jgi:hypothetical protein